MADIASLSVKLGLVTVEFDKATDGAIAKAKQLQKTFDDLGGKFQQFASLWKTLGGGIGVGTLGLGALIQQTASFADRISDLAQGLGVSTGFALQFSSALREAGVDGEAAGKIISKLFDNIENAREGNQQAVDSFRKLGISFEEIKTMKPEDAIRRVMASLADLQAKDPVKYVAELRKQLGKGGLGLDAQQVTDIIANGVGKFEEYGQKLEKVSKIKDNLAQSFDNLLIAFSNFIGPLTRDGVVSVEKFTGAMAGLATYFVASNIAAVATAFLGVASAVNKTAIATQLLNAVIGGSPVGLLLKIAAAGVGFLVYKNAQGELTTEGVNNPMGDANGGENWYANATENASAASAKPGATLTPTSKGGATPAEMAASAQLLAEKIKTANLEAAAGLPYWDEYSKRVYAVGTEAAFSLEQLNAKRAELQDKYKESPTLLGIELAKLKQQEKQIYANRDAKIKELDIQKQIDDAEKERVRQEGYRAGGQKMLEDGQKRNLDRLKYELDVNLENIDIEKQRNLLLIDGNTLMTSRQKELAKITTEHEATVQRLKTELDALPSFVEAIDGGVLDKATEDNNRRIEGIQKLIDAENERHRIRMSNIDQEREFGYGAQQAFNRLIDEGTNAAKTGGDMVASVFGNMDSALKNFVETGEISFGNLIRSMVKDLLYLQMRAQMMSLASSFFGSFFRGLNPAGGAGTMDSTATMAGATMFAADGGDVMSGQPYYVGENGPELFIPGGQKAGTIVPNNQLQGAMNNQPSVVYNGPYIASMNAIDTQSAAQFLAKNKQSVWASYQSANRSVPFSR